MNILTSCARFLDQTLTVLVAQPTPRDKDLVIAYNYTLFADVFNAKVGVFNGCTVALVTSVVFGFFGILSPRKAIFLGGCSLFVRQVAHESFKIVPKQAMDLIPNSIKKAAAGLVRELPKNLQALIVEKDMGIVKPEPSYHINGIVIFYNTIPRTLSQVTNGIAKAASELGEAVGKGIDDLLKG